MWALFNNSQPQNINAKNSFKSCFLMQQISTLGVIQKQIKVFQQQLNKVLRFNHQQFYKASKTPNQKQKPNHQDKNTIALFRQLRQNAISLSQIIYKANQNYEQSVQSRDLQKIHDHLFFKSTMRNYDDKRKQLKQYTFELQNKVQEKQYAAVSQRSYRGFNTALINQQPFSQISHNFRSSLDRLCVIQTELRKLLTKNDLLCRMACEKFKANQDKDTKKHQGQSMEQVQIYGLYSLLKTIRTKQAAIKKSYKNALKAIRANSTQLNLQNKSIRDASLRLQSEVSFLQIQNGLADNKSPAFRSDCIEYLKQISQKLKKKFNQGVNFNRSKNRSKSLVHIPFRDTDQKLKNSTKDSYQKISDDLSSSFMQHCQYLISQKLIVDADEQNV